MELISISPDNYEIAIELKVSENQEKYIASNLQSLAEAYAYREYAEAFLLKEEENFVGFCLLQVDKKDNFFDIWRIMIDHNFQGKGYGKMALLEVIDYLKKEGAQIVHIAHQENNYGVGELYKSVGFAYTDEIEDGEVLMELKV